MKIVSDFKDFYDVGKAGDDEDVPVYRRFPALHWLVPGPDRVVAPAAVVEAVRDLWRDDTVPPALRQPADGPPCPVERCVVGLCGVAHAVYVVHDEVRVVDGGGKERAPVRCCGSFEQLVKVVDERVAFWRGHDAAKSRAWGSLAEQLQHPPRRRFRRERALPRQHPRRAVDAGAAAHQRRAARRDPRLRSQLVSQQKRRPQNVGPLGVVMPAPGVGHVLLRAAVFLPRR